MKGLAAVGDVLAGKYRVDKILGIGGMGMVVAATHLEIDQRVALKFMLPGASDSPETTARFIREAKAAGRLNSDHVCRVFDVGRFDSGSPYIVMEYLQGESVAAMLRRHGPLRVSDAVDFVLQAIEGLAEAHAHGIIHRDLKPDNLFLHKRNDGGTVVKVLDFGISKVSVTGISTRTGDIMGSPAYMAPEQMESTRSVDQRADVWSLGVVLYQLVVGQAPFRGDTLPLLCMHVVNDDPELMSAIRGDLPDGFERAVMRCLRKEPDERYADVGELARALAPFGPKNASISASRIQVVLRRTGKHDSAALIHHDLGARDVTGAAPRESDPPHVNTLVGTAGQSLATRDGRSWGVVGAIATGAVVGALVIAMLWRTGWISDGDGDGPVIAKPVPAAAAAPPAPIVEPIVEDRPARTVAPVPAPASADAPTPIAASANPPAPAPPAGANPADAAGSAASPGSGTRPDRNKKRRPPRRPGSPAHGNPPGAGSGAGSAAGSAADDDDKWMHMTHDEKRP